MPKQLEVIFEPNRPDVKIEVSYFKGTDGNERVLLIYKPRRGQKVPAISTLSRTEMRQLQKLLSKLARSAI